MIREYKRGDIFYVAHGKNYNTNPKDITGRPAIIVSSDELNKYSPLVEVVYLTSYNKRELPTHVSVYCHRTSTAVCENLDTVKKENLCTFVRHLSDEEMTRVEHGILISLGMSEFTKNENDITHLRTERNTYEKLYKDLLNKVTGDKK